MNNEAHRNSILLKLMQLLGYIVSFCTVRLRVEFEIGKQQGAQRAHNELTQNAGHHKRTPMLILPPPERKDRVVY
jgi:hypothetical protein